MSHLDEQTLTRFNAGLLPSEELRRAVTHLNGCKECRARAEAVMGLGTESHTLPGEPPSDGAASRHTQELSADAGDRPHTQELSTAGKVQLRASSLERGTGLGRYVVIDKLGEGGMGVVYAAYDPDLDRKVALKLLRTRPGSSETADRRVRLLREAQAMARLSHRNVIAVYDVGTLGDQIFIAMELVEGGTLGAWMRAQRRPWREVVKTFIRAGRGLAAAHQAGLIHRDFKPDNVLLGKDGQVRVTDFGLARPSVPTDPPTPSGGALLEAQITLPGVLLGTPAYMAPEQLEHQEADARSDQFAFCVALYEALYGQRPFAGRRISELKPEVLAGRVRPPPADSPVPAYVRKAVQKGLCVRPEDRFASMEALLDTLSRDPRQVWRRALGSAAALGCLGLGLGAVVASRVRAPPVCGGAASRLAGVWDGGRKDAVHKAFLATGKPFAQASATEVARALDEYAAAWTAGHTDACEATRVRREQSEGLMELRMLCLDRRRQELDALGDLFSTADAQVVEKAVQASRALTPVKSCGDLASLTAGSLLPEDPAARPKVEAVRQQLARVNALEQAGRYREGLALAQEALATARTLSFRPLEAEVQLSVGALQHLSDDMKGAEASLTEAVLAATAGRHAEAAARAWTRLVAVEAELNPALAHAYGRHASAALEGFGHDEAMEARLLSNLGTVFYRQGDYPKAREHYRRSLALNEKTLSPDDPSLAVSYNNLANVVDLLGQYDDALAYNQRALAIKERSLGPDHPSVAKSLGNLSVVLTELGRYPEARAALERALGIFRQSMGEGTRVAITRNSLGDVLMAEGRYAEAQAQYEQALAIWKKKGGITGDAAFILANVGSAKLRQGKVAEALGDLRAAHAVVEREQGKDFPELSAILIALADAQLARRQLPEARSALTRALAIVEKKIGAESLRAGEAHHGFGELLLAQRKPREALEHYQRALLLKEKAMGSGYPGLVDDLIGLGESQLGLKAPGKAVEPLERALALLGTTPADGKPLARTRYALARALWDGKGDRARARELAEAAREAFAHAGEAHRKDTAEVQAWLKAHR